MNKETIKQVIIESQENVFPKMVPREIEIPLSSKKIITITGPRRSGKTFLFFLLIKKLIAKGISINRILYINFDDPRLLPSNSQDIELILESYRELYPEQRNKNNFIFFDEIQNVKDWEIGIRRIYDTRKFNIFLTGSSSKFLSKEIATNLRGRAINFEVLPFSFKEIILAKGIKIDRNIIYSQKRFSAIKCLDLYFELKEYLETMFFKDLIERYRIKNQNLIRELIRYLATNTASLFSLNSFYKWIKQTYPITKRTLINYVMYLEDIGLFFLVRKFSYSLKQQTLTPRKCYIVDNGFRNVYGFKFSEDRSRVLENTVFLELKHRQAKNPLMEIFYWQDYKKREVDFVVKQGKNINKLIQVCVDISDFKTEEREVASLVKAADQLNCKDLMVITLDNDREVKVKSKNIVYKSLFKWLIGA
jgi:predicted AAA+ superfamily ATPase